MKGNTLETRIILFSCGVFMTKHIIIGPMPPEPVHYISTTPRLILGLKLDL